jgi:hypothetical protein
MELNLDVCHFMIGVSIIRVNLSFSGDFIGVSIYELIKNVKNY